MQSEAGIPGRDLCSSTRQTNQCAANRTRGEAMSTKTYSIFGAGASGLYTAWRLLDGKPRPAKGKDRQLRAGDVLELYDWGKYDFSKAHPGTREPGARVCTWHDENDKTKSYVELGGMRYVQW